MADAKRRGDRFAHARMIIGSPRAGTARPDVCVITAVRNGRVYYRNESGQLFSKPAETLDRSVLHWINDEEAQ